MNLQVGGFWKTTGPAGEYTVGRRLSPFGVRADPGFRGLGFRGLGV